MSTEDAKIYLAERKIAPLFESLLTGLMFKKPPDHIQFMIDCLQRAKDGSIDDEFTWNYFMDVDSRPSPLPPILVKKSVTESKAVNKICTAPSKSQENPHSNLPIALPSRSFSTPLPPIQIPRVKQSKPIVSIIGGPGLGKEFYANYLAEQHPGWVVLSIGQILHETILVNSPTSEKWKAAKSSFFSGELISELEMLSVFPDCFDKHPHADGYILCGYPQTPRQLKNFENSATDENPKIVIFLDCDVEDIRNRLRHEDSNAVERRLENFKELTLSIVDYYNAIGKLITFKITEKVDPNEIAAQINQKFEEYVLKIPRSTIPSHHDSKVFQTKHTNRKEDLPQCPIIFFMGGPGSGKRYFCRKIAEKYPFVAHISIGNILNEEFLCQEPDHEDQNIMISQLIQSGNSLSQEKLISLIVAAIKNNPDAGIILIEDFPRDADQVKAFNENIGGLDLLIMLDCEEDYLKSKLTENFKLELQAEYIAEAVENRLNFFRNKTLPVIDHYKMMGKTQFINGSRNEKDVLIDIFEIMDVLEPVDKKIGSAQELKISVTGVNDIAPEGASVEQTTKTDLVAEDIKQNLETEPLHANISVEETETEAASSDTQEDIVVVFIVGGPGSGKGTQCDKLVRKFGFVHLSSGELLREEVSINSAIGKNVKELMEKGHLVPLDTVLKLLKNAVLTKFSTNRLFLIDGYPREVEQGIKFESEVAKCSFVIYFEVADETMISRLKNRSELSGRTDDNEQTVTERIHTFHIVTKPVIEYYKQKGILTTINANRSEEEIFSDVVKLFSTFPLISGSLLTDIKVIFVVGGPGSGKGTQCARMVDQYGFCHLSSGDLLREEVATQSTRGKELNAIMERGELVPLDIVLQLIREAMITNSSKSNCFLIDGYPRKLEQGIKFEKEIGPCRGVLYFEVPDSVMVERLLERAKTSGRIDDNEETIKKRLETFHNETKPVISYYNNLKKVVKVNADGSQDNVFAQVKTYLDSHSW